MIGKSLRFRLIVKKLKQMNIQWIYLLCNYSNLELITNKFPYLLE